MLCAFAPRQTLPFRVMIFAAFGISEAVAGHMWIGIFAPDARRPAQRRDRPGFQPGFAQPWLGDPRTALWALIVAASVERRRPAAACCASPRSRPSRNRCSKPPIWMAPTHGQVMRNIMMPLSMPGRARRHLHQPARRAARLRHHLHHDRRRPVRSTETVGYFMYRESMTQFKLGYGAAATVILLRGGRSSSRSPPSSSARQVRQ